MLYYSIVLSFQVSLKLPINSCTLYINIVIHMQRKINMILNDSQFSNQKATKYPFFWSSWQDISLILNNDVSCQRNIQVKYIVIWYRFQENHDSSMTPVIQVTLQMDTQILGKYVYVIVLYNLVFFMWASHYQLIHAHCI